MYPDFLSSRGVERDDRILPRQNIHHPIHHEGVEEIRTSIGGGICPRDLQLTYIGTVDLAERGILRGVRAAAIVAPGCVRLCSLCMHTRLSQETTAERRAEHAVFFHVSPSFTANYQREDTTWGLGVY